MNQSLEALRGEVLDRIQQAKTEAELEQLRVEVMGRSGNLTLRLRGLKDLAAEERQELEAALESRMTAVKVYAKAAALEAGRVDITLPGTRWERGRLHPLTLVIDEIVDIFASMGFEIARGPDIEDDYHNFAALNFP